MEQELENLRMFSEGELATIDKEIVDLLKKGAMEVCSHTPGGLFQAYLHFQRRAVEIGL